MKLMKHLKGINENFNIEYKILNVSEDRIDEILEVAAQVFGDVNSQDEIKEFLNDETNFDISKMVLVDDNVVGCYLFNETQINDFLDGHNDIMLEDISKYENKKGIQGLGLALLPEYRNIGVGKELRNIPLEMNYDYIWGQHLKGLHNIDNWLKFGRRVIADGVIDGEDMYVTIMDIK